MAYTLTNLQDDIRSYTEVSSTVLSSTVLDTIIKNSENKIIINLYIYLLRLTGA